MKLVNKVGLKLKESDFNRNKEKYRRLQDEVKSQVVDFYYWAVVTYTAPGLQDEIFVWTEKGKEKVRKYYLTIYLCEVYAMFKTVYPDSEIGFTMSTKLRPKNVLSKESTYGSVQLLFAWKFWFETGSSQN